MGWSTPEELQALVDGRGARRDRLSIGSTQADRLCINGTPFLAMVRDVETPLVALELQERAQSEDADEVVASFAGDYVNLPILELRLPSRVLLDEPQNDAGRGFSIDSGDPRCAKATLLECTCGITECWFLLAQIAVLEDVVVWTSFEQFHRDWVYDLGPFVFEKADYLRQIR